MVRTKDIRYALYELRDNGPIAKSNGICYNVYLIVIRHNSNPFYYEVIQELCCLIICRLAATWPERSGDFLYPIAGDNEKCTNVWEGENGEKRQRLIKWMIEKLNKNI